MSLQCIKERLELMGSLTEKNVEALADKIRKIKRETIIDLNKPSQSARLILFSGISYLFRQ
jgi:hypothetical protein